MNITFTTKFIEMNQFSESNQHNLTTAAHTHLKNNSFIFTLTLLLENLLLPAL